MAFLKDCANVYLIIRVIIMFLDIDFLKNNHELIHFFGLGFVQIKIDKNLRLHFYHPELQPIIHEEEIHNHRYDFISTVLAGKLTQEIFEIHAGESDFYMVEENCKAEKIIMPDKIPVIVKPISIQHFKKGESYTSLTNQFHRVVTDFAITRSYRGESNSVNALFIKNKNVIEGASISKKLTLDECWAIVESCIHLSKSTF